MIVMNNIRRVRGMQKFLECASCKKLTSKNGLQKSTHAMHMMKDYST